MPTIFTVNITSFNDDLSGVNLLEEDRLFIVRECLKPDNSITKSALKWNLQRNTVQNWVNKYRKGGQLACPRGGQVKIPSEFHPQLVNFVAKEMAKGPAPLDDQFKVKVMELMLQVAHSKGLGHVSNPGPRYIPRLIKECGLKTLAVNAGFAARMAAEYDIKSCISTLSMFSAGLRLVTSPFLVINYDATQFIVSQNMNHKVKVVATRGNSRNKNKRPIKGASNSKSHELDFGIKWFAIANAAGQTCDNLVFVIADNELDKEECLVYEVPCLTASVQVGAFGYVCFCKTRAGNAKFFKWLNITVLLPFIKLLKFNYGLDKHVFVTCDGEKLQTDPYFDNEVLTTLDEEKIIVGKLSASSSAVTQALDAWKVFCKLKFYLSSLNVTDVLHHTSLFNALDAMMVAHELATGHILTPSYKFRATQGLAQIRHIINRHYISSLIENSFNQIGLFTINGQVTLDCNQVLTQFSQTLNTFDYKNLQSNLKRSTDIMAVKGTITDEEMRFEFSAVANAETELAECETPVGLDRDKLCLTRQRCTILNNPNTIFAWNKRRLEIENAPAIAEAARLAKHEARLLKAIIGQESN